MKTIIILIFLCAFSNFIYSYGQLPDDDPTWQIVFSDEFDSIAVDAGKWNQIWGWNQSGYLITCDNDNNGTNDTISNLNIGYRKWKDYLDTFPAFPNCTISDTILNITSKEEYFEGVVWSWPNGVFTKDTIPFNYTTGMLYSKPKIRFGFFEIRCKLPMPSLPGSTNSLGPNFWIWGADDSISAYSEIDIFEFNSLLDYSDTSIINFLTSNWHFHECESEDTSCQGDTIFHHLNDYNNIYFGGIEFSNFHTFSMDWTELGIIYYLDHIPYCISSNPYASKMSLMKIIADINHPANNFCDSMVSPTTIFPYEFKIDYIKVWQLKQYCDSAINLCSFDAFSYDYALYKQISLGGSGCTPTIQSGSDITLRATDGILLDYGFTVALGAEFYAETTPCQQQMYFIPTTENLQPPPEFKILMKY